MEVEVERIGAVEVLRINRPEARNALNPAVLAGLGEGVRSADADPAVRAVIITGTGDKAFCAGMDLRGVASGERQGGGGGGGGTPAGTSAYVEFIRNGISKPVIGAANATALAGGFELLLRCDLVVAAEGAEFGLPEVKRGLFAAGGGVKLGRRIPMAVAMELALTGDRIGAPRALELGLVNRVVPADQVMPAALALADSVVANGPLGVAATKRLMRAAVDGSDDELWALQETLQASVFGSDDAREGALAFLEKRAPNWQAR